MPPAAVVSDDEPTLTTTRWAAATDARRHSVVLVVVLGLVLEVDVREPVLLVVAAGHVGAGLALGTVRHRGVDRAAPVGRGARLG